MRRGTASAPPPAQERATIQCSFCALKLGERPNVTMIAGPTVYICAECVGLCADIVVGNRTSSGSLHDVGGAVEKFAAMTKEIADAQSRIRELEFAIGQVVRAVAGVAPTRVRCMWCKRELDGEDNARAHVATCDQHPAVIELHAIKAQRAGGAA